MICPGRSYSLMTIPVSICPPQAKTYILKLYYNRKATCEVVSQMAFLITLQRIYNKTAQEEEEKYFNIGLKNIHERIQLLFTEKYGMWIDSTPEEGTIVTLHVPLI